MSLCLFVLVHLSSPSFEVVLVLLRSFLPFWAIGSKKGWIRWDGMVIIGHRSSKSNFCAEKRNYSHDYQRLPEVATRARKEEL